MFYAYVGWQNDTYQNNCEKYFLGPDAAYPSGTLKRPPPSWFVLGITSRSIKYQQIWRTSKVIALSVV